MLSPSTINFLKKLKNNNNKPWFDANRGEYEKAKENFYVFTEQMIKTISAFEPAIGTLTVKECVFRINRDVRFSKNKAPYKSNMAAYFNKGGKKDNGAGYYVHIEPGNSFAAGGIWMPTAPDLAKIRQEIDYNLKDWVKTLNSKSFKSSFAEGLDNTEMLVRPPKGYNEDNAAIEYLKHKSFIVKHGYDDKALTDRNFNKELGKTFKNMQPMIMFLNHALE